MRAALLRATPHYADFITSIFEFVITTAHCLHSSPQLQKRIDRNGPHKRLAVGRAVQFGFEAFIAHLTPLCCDGVAGIDVDQLF